MRLLLLSDGKVGTEITSWLSRTHPEDLALVVTTGVNDITTLCHERRIPTEIFASEEQICGLLSNSDVDLGVTAWWPRILKRDLLSLPKHGFVNTHPSLLPHNRGKHYNFWALVEQAPFGVSIHQISEGVDSGDVLAQSPIPYDWTDTGESLYRKAQIEMVELFCRTYSGIRTLNVSPTPQDLSEGSFHFASEIEAASFIDLDGLYKARDLLNLLRARSFEGHPACWFNESETFYEIRIQIKRRN